MESTWSTSAYVLQSTGVAPVGDEPAALHKYVLETLSAAEDLGAITILEKDVFLEEALADKGAAEHSATATIAALENGAEGVTPEMLAGLVQEKLLAQMKTDLEAKAEAEAAPPAEAVEVRKPSIMSCYSFGERGVGSLGLGL